ncbi:MAG: protein kinase [Chloroflexi bacterium]|nr:protein kinase [Chloroflexota bacterium]
MKDNWVIGGRYRVEATLGQGGMGTVYRGVDMQTGQTIAIKALKAEILNEDPNMLERFAREGEALRLLNHPNIVKMLGTAEEDGQHFLLMEYVGGGSLLDLLRREEQLPIKRALEIALDLADALTRAHRLKIIHRDIKPANVLITEDGTPKLTDFGVAQMGDRTRMTQSGSLIGTYAYLSPEMLEGMPPDARADIWAFGVMFYEMLGGRRPFMEEQTAALLTAILAKPVPPLRALRSDVPPLVENLVMRMLEKDREMRINSIRLVGAQLEAILSGDTSQIEGFQASANTEALRDELAAGSERFGTPTPTSIPSGLTSAPAGSPPVFSGVREPQGTFAPGAKAPSARPTPLLIGAGIVGLLVLLVLVLLALRPGGVALTNTIATVEPVAAGEYMVLVAQIDGSDERDVTGVVIDNLTRVLEIEIPFSNLRVRTYPAVIRSDEEARAAAEANAAPIVVWGSYDGQITTLDVQIGALTRFTYIAFERALLERTVNVRVQISDERQQSVTPQVVGIFTLLNNANGDGYATLRSLALQDALEVTPAEMPGNSVGARVQRGFQTYLSDPEQALSEISAALEQDTSNPILYSFRGLLYQSQGPEFLDAAERDVVTLRRLAPAGWLMPLYMEAGLAEINGDYARALELFSQIVEQRPDEWFPLNYRAALRYLLRDFTGAQEDYARVFTMNPDANFPYIASTVLALRQGRIADTRGYVQTVLTRFPDPTLANRISQVYYGRRAQNVFGPLFNAFGSLLLGQYEQGIAAAQQASAVMPTLADPYLIEGYAHCNLEQYEEAEAAYSQGILLDPDFAILYMLRAEVRQNLGRLPGALQDVRALRAVDLGAEFAQLVAQGVSGEVTCANFFTS